MRAKSLFCLTVLSLAVAVLAVAKLGRTGTAVGEAAPLAAPACPCPCDPCDCPPEAGAAGWWPGKLLWRTVSYPFRRHPPRRPIAPRLWGPRCYEVSR